MTEFAVFTTTGTKLIGAPNQKEAAALAVKDGHTLAPKELWLQDLETTDVGQATGCLNDAEGFCCLGRACIVAEKHGVALERAQDGYLFGSTLATQERVQKWLGLRWPSGAPAVYVDQRTPRGLAVMNDNGKTFKEIAKTVRANPEVYFVN